MSQAAVEQRASVRRALAWALVAALCVAALTAIGAILSGDLGDTDVLVIVSSVGFAVFSATAASGAALRVGDSQGLRALGLATIAISAAAFLLLLLALWADGGGEGRWRLFASVALAAFAGSHVSIVSRGLRAWDSLAVQVLAHTSIALALGDALLGILATSGAVEEVDEGPAQLMAVLVILLVLTTALPPILRRLQRRVAAPGRSGDPPATAGGAGVDRGASDPAATGASYERTSPGMAVEVLAAADRIEALNADPGNRSPEIRRECERLRGLARSHLA